MTITVALLIYSGLVALVSSLMLYYFKVIRPKEEAQYK